MIFEPTSVDGAYLIGLEKREDARGFFARAFATEEFAARGLETSIMQCNLSFNVHSGVLRGMHYQTTPAAEAKLVRCIQGAVYDVIIDLRPNSKTFMKHFGVELNPENRLALYVPPLCAHGYQTLSGNTEVFYCVSKPYMPAFERGVRYDDPAFGIAWPLPISEVSPKDACWPAFSASELRP